ncbi:MAG: hypothetical protein QM488_11315, partial [Rhizobiaceae bacterium]
MTEIEKAEQNIRNALETEFHSVLRDNEALNSQVDTAIADWRLETTHHVYAEFPFAEHEKALQRWQKAAFEGLAASEHDELLSEYSRFCGSAKVFIDAEFWRHEFGLNIKDETQQNLAQPSKSDLYVARTLLFEEWQKSLDQAFIDWELEEIKRLQDKFLQDILDHLEVLTQLFESLAEL